MPDDENSTNFDYEALLARLNPDMSDPTTAYLFNPANAPELLESIAQVEAGMVEEHELLGVDASTPPKD